MATQRTVRTWMAVDGVLVVVLLVLVVGRLASGAGSSGEAAPSPSSTLQVQGPTARPTAPVSFRLPSGNIACSLAPSGVTCTIANIAYPPPLVPGCDGDTGHVVLLNRDGFAFDCVNGPPPAVAGDDGDVLESGSTATSGDYRCSSATNGVTCTDTDGVGFTLARAAWRERP